MPTFERGGPGPGGAELFFRDIVATFDNALMRQRAKLGEELLSTVKNNIRLGKRTGRYSTRAGWFSLRFPNSLNGRLVAAADQHKRLRGADGMVTAAGYFPRGYAQFRAAYRGESIRVRPVTFELTGEMMRNLSATSRRTRPGEATVYLGFARQQRSYGRLTNRELAEILSRRGSGRSPFQPTEGQERNLVQRAIRRMERDAARGL